MNQLKGLSSTSKRKLQDKEAVDYFMKRIMRFKNFSIGKEVYIPGLGTLIPTEEYKDKVRDVIRKIKSGKKIILREKFKRISLVKLKKVVILTNREKLPKINVVKKTKKRKVMSTKIPEAGGEIELLENGSYPAICYGIAIIGKVKETYKNVEKTVKKIRIFWEMPGEKFTYSKDGEEKTVTYTISQKFTYSASSNGNLLKVLKPWSNGKITKDTIAGFDIAEMVGKRGLLSVEQRKSQSSERTYLNFQGIISPPKGFILDKPTQPTFVFDVDDFKEEEFKKLPHWVMKEVAESEEFQKLKVRLEDFIDDAGTPAEDKEVDSEQDGW